MKTETSSIKSLWLISKKDDLFWIISPFIFSFLFISIYFISTIYSTISKATITLILYLFWALLFDSTYVFATYTRTYFDKEFYLKNTSLLLKSFSLFAVGPIFILSTFIFREGFYSTNIAFIMFNRFAFCYAFYHLIRQHRGFILLSTEIRTKKQVQSLENLTVIFSSSERYTPLLQVLKT
ncbi:MAG: hypothetical protein JKY08_08390 [Flavobacteriaceae bacterium]|nr:hypothetical protein [Flavobacteriaceae bacterium]